jgi:hypothetical protein
LKEINFVKNSEGEFVLVMDTYGLVILSTEELAVLVKKAQEALESVKCQCGSVHKKEGN